MLTSTNLTKSAKEFEEAAKSARIVAEEEGSTPQSAWLVIAAAICSLASHALHELAEEKNKSIRENRR